MKVRFETSPCRVGKVGTEEGRRLKLPVRKEHVVRERRDSRKSRVKSSVGGT